MLSFYMPKTPVVMNQALYDYCKKSTEESVRKQSEKYSLERNKPKITISPENSDGNDKPEFNFYGLLAFLSVTTMAFFFYKRLN
jgi:hypothetical protein